MKGDFGPSSGFALVNDVVNALAAISVWRNCVLRLNHAELPLLWARNGQILATLFDVKGDFSLNPEKLKAAVGWGETLGAPPHLGGNIGLPQTPPVPFAHRSREVLAARRRTPACLMGGELALPFLLFIPFVWSSIHSLIHSTRRFECLRESGTGLSTKDRAWSKTGEMWGEADKTDINPYCGC